MLCAFPYQHMITQEAMYACFWRSPIKTSFVSTSASLLCQKDLTKDPCHDKCEVGIPWPHGSSQCEGRNPLVREGCTLTFVHTTNHTQLPKYMSVVDVDRPIW